jgi:hypothetical protein
MLSIRLTTCSSAFSAPPPFYQSAQNLFGSADLAQKLQPDDFPFCRCWSEELLHKYGVPRPYFLLAASSVMALSQLLMAYASKGFILFTRVSDWGMAFHASVVGLPVPYSGAVAVLLVDNSVRSYRSLLSESKLRGQSAVPFCPKAVYLPSTPTYIERTDVRPRRRLNAPFLRIEIIALSVGFESHQSFCAIKICVHESTVACLCDQLAEFDYSERGSQMLSRTGFIWRGASHRVIMCFVLWMFVDEVTTVCLQTWARCTRASCWWASRTAATCPSCPPSPASSSASRTSARSTTSSGT